MIHPSQMKATTMHRTILIATVLLNAGGTVFAEESTWLPISLDGGATTDAFASHFDWSGQEDEEWEEDSDEVGIESFAALPTQASAAAFSVMSSGSADAWLDGDLRDTGFSISVDAATSAFGSSAGRTFLVLVLCSTSPTISPTSIRSSTERRSRTGRSARSRERRSSEVRSGG